jgi:hypothetical protein
MSVKITSALDDATDQIGGKAQAYESFRICACLAKSVRFLLMQHRMPADAGDPADRLALPEGDPTKMNDPTNFHSDATEPSESDAAARRSFLKRSGGAALAAPAVMLLLAAQSKNAQATGYTGGGKKDSTPSSSSGKNLLDPP